MMYQGLGFYRPQQAYQCTFSHHQPFPKIYNISDENKITIFVSFFGALLWLWWNSRAKGTIFWRGDSSVKTIKIGTVHGFWNSPNVQGLSRFPGQSQRPKIVMGSWVSGKDSAIQGMAKKICTCCLDFIFKRKIKVNIDLKIAINSNFGHFRRIFLCFGITLIYLIINVLQ